MEKDSTHNIHESTLVTVTTDIYERKLLYLIVIKTVKIYLLLKIIFLWWAGRNTEKILILIMI